MKRHLKTLQPAQPPLPGLHNAILAIALGVASLSSELHAQSTTGSLFGQLPAATAAGKTILVTNDAGFKREVPVGENGRYSIDPLPVGTYTVTLRENGQTLGTRENVLLKPNSGTDVSFSATASTAATLGAVTVTANAAQAIDVSSVDSRSVFTSKQMAILPVGRSAEAVALLAPGTIAGSTAFTAFAGPLGNTNLVSFGGSSLTENAYYINGFNTTDPLSGFGGITLPYGAIDQEEVLTGGYGPAFGRSDGGVLSMNGKRGSNDWHFGGQVQWTPESLRSSYADWYYPQNTGSRAGKIFQARSGSGSWTTVEDAYVSGPIIQDTLFFFISAEQSKQKGNSIGSIASPYNTQYVYHDPKVYAKIDWHITDNHILEYTRVTNKDQYDAADFNYAYANRTTGAFNDYPQFHKTAAADSIFKYTGYLSDDLTVSAMFGKQTIQYFTQNPAYPGFDPTAPNIITAANQNPDLTGGAIYAGPNPTLNINDPTHRSYNSNLRLDVNYKLGDHSLSAGIDNQHTSDYHDGQGMSGPGYAWEYNTGLPTTAISDNPFVDAPGKYPGGATGYYVAKYIFETGATVAVKQHAQYIEDSWQVSDRWLVKLGLRNDAFTNYNPAGAAYLNLTKPQWAPRLGFSWDANGDSSLKVFGNAGRYYLAMPASVALRGAAGSVYTRAYYTYTGIDKNGIPTGLTPINTANGLGAPVSANNEYGQPPDPNTVAAQNIKSENQDEYVLGFDQQINDMWTWGAKGMYRRLNAGLDDICDQDTIYAKAVSLGYTGAQSALNGCYLSNPGKTNIYRVATGNGGYLNVPVTAADFGMPRMSRNYYAMMLHLEHPFDGKWMARVDYIFSRSYGNSEGQVRSDLGQADVAATVDWDFGQFESYANGYLPNDRKHVLKGFAAYQLTPEWLLAGTLNIASGAPKSCLGFFGPDQTNPTGYGSYYHWCDGKPSPPGAAGRNPWTHALNLNVEYRPEFAGRKLALNLDVFNVFNEQNVTQTYAIYQQAGAVATSYGRPYSMTAPFSVRFGVSYDF
jgi:TonB-dependent Receptor Plug Domain